MRSEMFGGKIMLALARRTVHDRDLILFCPSPQTTAEASCHSHQMIVLQVFVGTVQRAPPYADASAKLTPPEISVQNYAIHAIITAFEKIVVQRAQLVWHVSERNRSAPLPQLLTRSCPTGAIFSEHTLRKNVGSFPLHSRAQNATITLTHIFSPNWINEARVSYYRSYFYFGG